MAVSLVGIALGALLRWRALWVARRVYRTAWWRGSSVEQAAQMLGAMGWVLIGLALIQAVLAFFGIRLPVLR